MSRRAADWLRQVRERHRFIRGLFARISFPSQPVQRRCQPVTCEATTMPAWEKRLIAYSAACLIGLGFVCWLFPPAWLLPLAPLDLAWGGDGAQHVIGQRYFLRDSWHWPLLVVQRLGAPFGTSIAMTDSLPLASLLLRPVHGWFAPGTTFVEQWVFAAWALQPAAAVFALRSAGERRLMPALAAAALSLMIPSLLHRFGQSALCSHFLLLTAIGLYFRAVHAPSPAIWGCALALLAAALLIHPYIFAMSAAVLAAAPMTLLLRRDPEWLPAGMRIGGSLALVLGLAWLLGYLGSDPEGGFGLYSMNLLGPVFPANSSLFPGLALDATGGQGLEGYQYLGLGILLLVGLALALQRKRCLAITRRHAGLAIVCLGLTVVALSDRVYFGSTLILRPRFIPGFVQTTLRASGRLFWPTSYVLLIAALAGVAASLRPRFAAPVLAAVVGLQFLDTMALRDGIFTRVRTASDWAIPHATLRPLFAASDSLTLWPSFGCGASADSPAFMQHLLLASETAMQTNTMYTARTSPDLDCDATRAVGEPLHPGELRIVDATKAEAMVFMPDMARWCRSRGGETVCTRHIDLLGPGYGPPVLPPTPDLPRGVPIALVSDAGRKSLITGWEIPSRAGAWTTSKHAVIRGHVEGPTGVTATLTLRAQVLGRSSGASQTARIIVDGHPAAEWTISETNPILAEAAASQIQVPVTLDESGNLTIEFELPNPVRPFDRWGGTDRRSLALFLWSYRVE